MRRPLIAFAVLLVNSAWIAAFPAASVLYVANVLLHLGLGLALTIVAILAAKRYPREAGAWIAAAVPAVYLVFRGNTLDHGAVLTLHIALALLAAALVAFRIRRAAPAFLALLVLASGAVAWRKLHTPAALAIVNPPSAPLSMNDEGAGDKSPFAPSSARTNTGNIIPANFFMDSEGCGHCHQDIYKQWNSSAHHFASFNNQFYRKSIEYMQSVVGTRPTKWCAACHDHAVFFNGRFDKPIKDQIDTPEAHAGLGCMSCHAIVHVGSTMGNSDFTVEYPPLHEIAASKNKYLQAVDYFITFLNPEPHRRTFLKPFMRQSEFCSACHKVHLDIPVNDYRWVRGFNDYDNWQGSGISGQGARSFYYPDKPSGCADCHMPLTPSSDPGNHGGKIHSHRFPAANMALAYVNKDEAQMAAIEKFLKSGFITVDIFAISPASDSQPGAMIRRGNIPTANTTLAAGEDSDVSAPATIREVGRIAAPIDASGAALESGSTALVDVVVRTRKIGHFFPGGTVDAFDVWLELQATDADGNVIFHSGSVEDGGKGPVEPGAHFYRSYQLDADSNPINKRNAFQTRSTLYAHLIPPGAADVAHYRVKIPAKARGPISFSAKLNYRKFSWYYTQFSYGSRPKPGQDPALLNKAYNNLEYEFTADAIPANVSGKIRGQIPNLPILTIAQAEVAVPTGRSQWTPIVRKQDRERWNDWGIGLLLQGDLKGAEYAFKRVTEAEPGYADGWLNVARALIQEGETDAAKPYIEKALSINKELGRIWFFKAAIQRADGDYDGALQSLELTRSKYPRDRVVLNRIAGIQFLKRQYKQALETLTGVNAVDPEDVQLHYTAMLCYRGLGDTASANREETLFRRFKADEASQTITARRRSVSPEDNNERQTIHEHESAVSR